MSFGETLRKLREKKGLTQAGLAEKSGVSIRTIQAWEQGHRQPDLTPFSCLARTLGVSMEAFVHCEDLTHRRRAGMPNRVHRTE